MIITLGLSFLLLGLILAVLWKVRTPYYRLQRDNVIALLTLVVEGRATDNDWNVFTAVPLRHDPLLEAIRQRCLDIEEQEYTGDATPPYLFTAKGMAELAEILSELRLGTDDSGF